MSIETEREGIDAAGRARQGLAERGDSQTKQEVEARQPPGERASERSPATERRGAAVGDWRRGCPDAGLQQLLEDHRPTQLTNSTSYPRIRPERSRASDYDFMDPRRARSSRNLLEMLQQQVMQQTSRACSRRSAQMTPEIWREMRQMMRSSTRCSRARRAARTGLRAVHAAWGHFFGPDVN